MPLFRILVGLVVLGICAAVLSLIFNVLKALLIVAALALGLGVVLGLRRFRHRRIGAPSPPARSAPARGRTVR